MCQTYENVIADTPEISLDIVVIVTNNVDSDGLEVCGAGCIVFQSTRVHMLRAVQFDDQFCLMTIEICNVSSDNFLSSETGIAVAQKVIPKVTFFLGHVFTQSFSKGGEIFVSWNSHIDLRE